MIMKNCLVLFFLVFVLSSPLLSRGQVIDTDAAKAVAEFHGVLLEVMKADSSLVKEQLLEPRVKYFFDVATIARISLGRSWKKLGVEQQQQFVETLSELIVATYVDRFDRYDNQRFTIDDSETLKKGMIIKTTIHRGDKELAKLNYYFRDGRVFNVVANGISDLSLRRAEYRSVIKEQGFEVLLQQINNKIQESRASD
jgi:phospholipid transport system substrate-binding protein